MIEAFNGPATYLVIIGLFAASFYLVPAIYMGTADYSKDKK